MNPGVVAAVVVALGLVGIYLLWRYVFFASPPAAPTFSPKQEKAGREVGARAAFGVATREAGEVAAMLDEAEARAIRGDISANENAAWIRGFYYQLHVERAAYLHKQLPEAERLMREERIKAAMARINEIGA